MVALAAKRYDIPFYVAAPMSTFDFENNIFDTIIEQRLPEEVLCINGKYISKKQTNVENPAFDIVESDLITGIITEEGIKNHYNTFFYSLFYLIFISRAICHTPGLWDFTFLIFKTSVSRG